MTYWFVFSAELSLSRTDGITKPISCANCLRKITGGMEFTAVLQMYSIATIGDGLVSQIPALLISTSTGMSHDNQLDMRHSRHQSNNKQQYAANQERLRLCKELGRNVRVQAALGYGTRNNHTRGSA